MKIAKIFFEKKSSTRKRSRHYRVSREKANGSSAGMWGCSWNAPGQSDRVGLHSVPRALPKDTAEWPASPGNQTQGEHNRIACAEDKAGLLEVDLMLKIENKEKVRYELKDRLARKSGDNLLLDGKVSRLGHSWVAMVDQHDALLALRLK